MPLICSNEICVNWSLLQIVDNAKYISMNAFYDVGAEALADAIRITHTIGRFHPSRLVRKSSSDCWFTDWSRKNGYHDCATFGGWGWLIRKPKTEMTEMQMNYTHYISPRDAYGNNTRADWQWLRTSHLIIVRAIQPSVNQPAVYLPHQRRHNFYESKLTVG